MDNLTDKILEKASTEIGVSKECIMCVSFLCFMRLPKEDQMQLLKEEYEARRKQKVLLNANGAS